jgi:ethanolamine ammonia-lyase small subunit
MAEPPRLLDPRWLKLRSATPARIGLARAGAAVTSRELLAFQRAHAEARDAVHEKLDAAPLLAGLAAQGLAPVALASAAGDRHRYLLRPDLGRRLDDASRDRLAALPHGHDLVFVLADGLSARALMRHAVPLLAAALPSFRAQAWRIGPVAVVEQGRVAIGDAIGAALDAALVAVLIGERPGLSAPDSLGIYLTWAPKPGRSDAERNCLSNIRPEGMGYTEAAQRLFHLAAEARRRKLTGIALKDETMPSLTSGDGAS